MKHGLARVAASSRCLWLALPVARARRDAAGEEEEFDPSHECELQEWIPIHIGPLDLSINKAVAYLILGTICTIGLGLFLMRARIGSKTRSAGARRSGRWSTTSRRRRSPSRASRTRRSRAGSRTSPRCSCSSGSVNMLGFIPLPLSDETFELFGVELPTLAIFAATSSLSVTLALALLTFVFTHVEGIRYNGAVKYFKSWIPDVPKALYPLIVPLEILGQFMRLISLSVRLYANMLAGHMLILTFIGLIFVTSPCGLPVSGLRVGVLPLRGRDRRLDPGLHLRRPLRHLHRLGDRAGALRRRNTVQSARPGSRRRSNVDAGKAIALALGIGLGSLGAGIGIGNIFGSMIQAVARQPELRGELTGIQWLGLSNNPERRC